MWSLICQQWPSLMLQRNRLRGTLPEQLAELGRRLFVWTFVVASNALSGTIPQCICSLNGPLLPVLELELDRG